MSPVSFNNGEQFWHPESKGSKSSFNFGHRNEKERKKATIHLVAIMMRRGEEGKEPKEVVQKCLNFNAEKLNMDKFELLEKALEELESLPEEE